MWEAYFWAFSVEVLFKRGNSIDSGIDVAGKDEKKLCDVENVVFQLKSI